MLLYIYFPPEHVVQLGYDQTKMSQSYTEVIYGEIILKPYLALELCTPNNINDSKPR